MKRPLTPKQEAFCLAYIETGNASEAYRRAYNAGKMKGPTVNKRSNELLSNGAITGRLDALRKPALEKALCTLEQHLNDLKALRNGAVKAGQFSAAITAEGLRGKASGHYSERSKDDDETPPPVKVEVVVKDARKHDNN